MRLVKKKDEDRRGFWRKVVDFAMTDVRVAVHGLDEASLEELEERLLAADFGVKATMRLLDHVEDLTRRGKLHGPGALAQGLQEELERILGAEGEPELAEAEEGPTLYLVVGVNGVGKTTSIAKLARLFQQEGRSVMVAAADTYRAGAVEQLRLWAERLGVGFVGGQEGGDAAAVAFDAVEAARARKVDVVLVDTAGRLHTHGNLMEELKKVDRVVRRKLPGAPHETLLVLDATVGQNALSQVRAFREAVEPTGIVLAKTDSTARGGIVVALQEEYGIPVKVVGTGERPEDLDPFDPRAFVEGVFAD